ncbi:MAG TPA: hypothetical protein VLF67_05195 [Candidatus Saccharimonas sp.]|nr:hypothetical protein [Candidatus Saccharimonas sp.]
MSAGILFIIGVVVFAGLVAGLLIYQAKNPGGPRVHNPKGD